MSDLKLLFAEMASKEQQKSKEPHNPCCRTDQFRAKICEVRNGKYSKSEYDQRASNCFDHMENLCFTHVLLICKRLFFFLTYSLSFLNDVLFFTNGSIDFFFQQKEKWFLLPLQQAERTIN